MIRETAREMARYRPATLVHPGRRATWYGDDTQRSRAIALLNALLGSWGRRGRVLPARQHGRARVSLSALPGLVRRARSTTPGSRYPFANEGITTGIRQATLTGEPYPVKGWITYATNLIHALPNEARDRQGHRGAGSAGRGRRHSYRDCRLGRCRAARVGVPRAVRRAERRAVPRAVRRAAAARGGRPARPEAELVDRADAG